MDNKDLKISLQLKDGFSKKRFDEKIELLKVRDSFMVKIINLRDDMAKKRHDERIEILRETY